ncbi:MAG: hypothetical protein R6X13_03575 [bacterium]
MRQDSPSRSPVEGVTSTQRRLLHDIDKKHAAARRGFVLRVVWADDPRNPGHASAFHPPPACQENG